jgi:hypothetical protein
MFGVDWTDIVVDNRVAEMSEINVSNPKRCSRDSLDWDDCSNVATKENCIRLLCRLVPGILRNRWRDSHECGSLKR